MTSALILAGIGIVAVTLLGVVLISARRRLLAKPSEDQAGLFDSLRQMRDRGQLSPAEFDAARKRMAARVAGVPPPPSAATQPPPPDPAVRIARPGFDLTGAPLPTSIRPLNPLRPLAPPPATPDKPPENNRPSEPG
jgi:hypothetical protein